jgi:subtilase family serine protease
MGAYMRLGRSSLVSAALVSVLAVSFLRASAQGTSFYAQIIEAIDESKLVSLSRNVHPLARLEFDQGAAPPDLPMDRMLLVLKRSPQQGAALTKLLDDQQDKSSPRYHQWLTPDQFGQQFGLADSDLQTVTSWLQSHGFSVSQVSKGRTVIEFSGTALQIREALHTSIHSYVVNGEQHWANSSDPQISAALESAVAGVVSLHNFPRTSHAKFLGQFRRATPNASLEPLFTFPSPFGAGNFYGLGPGDFATIYNSKPLIAAGNDGTGQVIAIVGQTNINIQDVQQFRQMFGLPGNFGATNVILNGVDPGITSRSEEGEADLDVEWSGAVAPGATVKLVVSASTLASAGIDLSALYIVENNLASVISESYGACEGALGSAGNAFYNSLWQQAAAQGITVVLSAGDGGSAGCDDFNTQQVATHGLAVSGLASTPFNVSVGGTDFDQVNNWASYWNSTNDPTGTSARSYIPEIPWNENCAQIGLTGCGTNAPNGSANIVAGSGGPSSLYGKPKWQMGVNGVPNDNHRDQPDISLFASPGFDGTGYIYCQGDHTLSHVTTCDLNLSNSNGVNFGIVGGTSASAPAFAGIMALLNQYQAAHGGPSRQGNANYVLYALAKKPGASCTSSATEPAGCVFNDVTKGNSVLPTGAPGVGTNSVPCQGGSLNCSVSGTGSRGVLVDPANPATEAWTAAAAYDMTTGLGTVNVNNLVTNWGGVSMIPTTTTLAISPTTGITHGSSENVNVTINVTANTGTGVPAGDVSLIATFSDGTTRGLVQFTLTSGTINGATTQVFPGGTYNVVAHYAGDGTNAPSDSNTVQVTAAPESSKLFGNLVTLDVNGHPTNFTASNATYGSGYYLFRMDVADSAASVSASTGISSNCSRGITNCPTGTVAVTTNGGPLASGSLPLNIEGYAENSSLPTGTYALTANYAGDTSYGPSSAVANFTIAKAPATASAAVSGVPVQYGNNEQVAAAILTSSNGAAPTGTVSFSADGSPLPVSMLTYQGYPYHPNVSPPFYATLSASGNAVFLSLGNHTLTAQYSGDQTTPLQPVRLPRLR